MEKKRTRYAQGKQVRTQTAKGARTGGRAGGGARGGRKGGAPQHPGVVLASVLADTPLSLAAKWFGLTPEALARVYAGEAPVTVEMAAQAGSIFGTGSAPWLEMQAAWDEAVAAAEAREAP